MKTFPLFKVHVPVEDALARIRVVLDSGFINEGTQVTEFTTAMSSALSADNLILTNSCTSSLTLALHLAGVGHDDQSEVITTPMTCVATNTPISTRGAKIVWADVNPNTGMLTAETVKAKLTHRTKAVIVVAWAGNPPELEELQTLCHQNGIKLILDAAHAFGALYDGKPIHTFADYTCYSFQAIKHITTGDGGALICSNIADYKRSKALKWFGLDRDQAKDAAGNWKGQQWDVDIKEAGYKFNMNNVSAAIGLSQIPFIAGIIGSHQRNALRYDGLFHGATTIKPVYKSPRSTPSSWVYTMLLSPDANITRDELLKKLNAEGIMAGVVHVPNDAYSAFVDYSASDLPGVTAFSDCQFSLPCGWWLSDDDVEYIAFRVKALVSHHV